MQINLNVREALARQIPTLAIDVEVTVFEGEVLLTGAIPSIEVIHTILTATWSVPGVRKIYNYVRLDSAPDIQDISLETAKALQIKSELAITAGIESANYKLILENGTVYLMGICSSESEYQAVLSVLKSTDGVEKIVPLMRQTLED
jgi:osmotically-inducible protein OsmY